MQLRLSPDYIINCDSAYVRRMPRSRSIRPKDETTKLSASLLGIIVYKSLQCNCISLCVWCLLSSDEVATVAVQPFCAFCQSRHVGTCMCRKPVKFYTVYLQAKLAVSISRSSFRQRQKPVCAFTSPPSSSYPMSPRLTVPTARAQEILRD